jgi:membrane-bound metal-dependent hydrolase YbcI (DUF457 family)
MMGPSHALSGAAAWLAGSWALDYFGQYHQTGTQLAIGTAVCAGGALLPDLDLSGRVTAGKGGATVANTFGRLSLFAAEAVEKVSLMVYRATRMKRDPRRHNGHRTLTHTVPIAIAIGLLTSWACGAGGKWAVVGILFVMLGLALRGLLHTWAERAGWVPITIASGAAAYGTYLYLPAGRGYPLLGLAAGAGCFIHLLGDIITRAGVPIMWPIPTGRRMWKMFGVPNALAVSVGGWVERVLLRGAFALICVAAATALLGPIILEKFDPRL